MVYVSLFLIIRGITELLNLNPTLAEFAAVRLATVLLITTDFEDFSNNISMTTP